jgi:hypothetical protein
MTKTKDVWQLVENHASGCEDIASLYSWSLNYDSGKGPFTLFLDLIGWSEEHLGEPMYPRDYTGLGYLELAELAGALQAVANNGEHAYRYVEQLMDAEMQDNETGE